MNRRLSLARVLGSEGPNISAAMRAGLRFLDRRDTGQLLRHVGQAIAGIPAFTPIDKSALPASYGGKQRGASDDFLVGRGLFYLTEQRRLFLDCTAGHYQMAWGYNHPGLGAALAAASRAGVVWDNHSNIPQAPLKRLAHQLVELGNAPGEKAPLDTVLLGVCTGSVACAAALKIQLKVFAREHGAAAVPVVAVLRGNYHGTDMVAQFLRGMWPGLLSRLEVVVLEPNDADALEAAFRQHGARLAGFWAEPIMMNREALALEAEYLRLAQRLCRETGALMCLDEIQTGFWEPEIFAYRRLGLQPDLVVLGKGMTAGYHPLAGVLLRGRHDVLEQYDAISTNGSAALPAFVALCSLEMIQEQADRIRETGRRIQEGFQGLAAEFPGPLLCAQGRGHLTGLKFRHVAAAKQFQGQLLEAGLWTRVHAYHEGHSTILTKLGLLADDSVVDFVLDSFRKLVRRDASRSRHVRKGRR
ncbi:MAG: aminotransferase class III-fold pyridoxal phosphate-dependent enzyme [Verrucomicrobiota bacterium]|jgi:acetylornithine aminotransferase